MDQRMEDKPWMAVPQFGGWDQKSGSPDYSMVFSRARANRKQVKTTINRASLGTEEELKALQQRDGDHHQPRKKIFTYLCCMRA
ncbi:uncharacterized protein LOC116257433 isoform X2 [Nymphaea colorata]|uniref:uncharacterized protein LOC116257433 isoform X2 n=1 Tax=Nymphaea colorata TaxID=210225 RepID=UPI00129E3504|nr:uncharacterized protein LOC116257433 isoform X2 [Nymphaea colorata]